MMIHGSLERLSGWGGPITLPLSAGQFDSERVAVGAGYAATSARFRVIKVHAPKDLRAIHRSTRAIAHVGTGLARKVAAVRGVERGRVVVTRRAWPNEIVRLIIELVVDRNPVVASVRDVERDRFKLGLRGGLVCREREQHVVPPSTSSEHLFVGKVAVGESKEGNLPVCIQRHCERPLAIR